MVGAECGRGTTTMIVVETSTVPIPAIEEFAVGSVVERRGSAWHARSFMPAVDFKPAGNRGPLCFPAPPTAFERLDALGTRTTINMDGGRVVAWYYSRGRDVVAPKGVFSGEL